MSADVFEVSDLMLCIQRLALIAWQNPDLDYPKAHDCF